MRTTEEARCKQSFVLADVLRLRFRGALGWFGEFGRSAVKLVSAQLANQLHLLLLHEVWRSWLGCVCLVDFCLNGLLPGCDWRPCPTNISQIAVCFHSGPIRPPASLTALKHPHLPLWRNSHLLTNLCFTRGKSRTGCSPESLVRCKHVW